MRVKFKNNILIFGTVFAVINSGDLSITKNIEGEILNEKNNQCS